MHLIPCTMGENKLSSIQAAKLVFENTVWFFRVLKELIYNCYPRFTAQFWCELWYILGTKISSSKEFHPQSDGKSECTSRMFKQILGLHIYNRPPSAWLDALLYIEFAIISTTSQSTGYLPFFILYR